ncbi:MAG: hypothetical protein AB7K24_15255 [Gemmataceae bacterium]
MGDKILHQGCQLKCSLCQGAITCPAPLNQLGKVGGNLILLQTDEFLIDISNCMFKNQPPNVPCVPGPLPFTWAKPSQLKTITGIPVLLQTSMGTFIGALGSPVPVQIQDSVPPTEATTL